MSDEADSPVTNSTPSEEDTSQLVAQLTASYATNTPQTTTQTSSTSAPAPPPSSVSISKLPLLAPSQPQQAGSAQLSPNNPTNATPLPKSLGGAFGAAQWAADARNRKPSNSQQQPVTPSQQGNGQSKQHPIHGQYISPYYVDLGNGSPAPWSNQQQRQNQLSAQLAQSTIPSPAFQGQQNSPWTPTIPSEMATPGSAPTPAADGDESDSDTAEHNADGSNDPKYRNRGGSRQRLSHEDKINVIRIAIELFPHEKPRWRQLNDFWAKVGTVYQQRFGKSVGKIRPMADRLIKIHRAYVERCEQIPGSIRDETSMTKVLDEWIALEDPLKAMSKTWQLSQHDVDGNRSWPTKKRSREDGDEEQSGRNGLDPNMRGSVVPSQPNQQGFPGQSPMNNGFVSQPGFPQQFQRPNQQGFPPPPPPAYFPPSDMRVDNGNPQQRGGPPNGPNNHVPQYSSPYTAGMKPPAATPPTAIQALSSIEEAMKSLANVMQREQMQAAAAAHQQSQKQAIQGQVSPAPSNLEKRMDRLNKRFDKWEETRKRDMEMIQGMFGEMKERFRDVDEIKGILRGMGRGEGLGVGDGEGEQGQGQGHEVIDVDAGEGGEEDGGG